MTTAVYGKQYVRFAETVSVNAKENLQFRLLQDFGLSNGGAPTGIYSTKIAAAGGEIIGVNQYSIPAVSDADSVTIPAEPQSSRLATVANSGLLLIEADSVNPPALGTAIQAKVDGTVDDGTAGSPITYGNSEIYVRELVKTGGATFALCSFV